MTKLLLRLFVPGYQQAQTPQARSRVGKLSGIIGCLANIALFGLKLAVGTISGSVSITADAMNNLSDATSSIVTLIGFKLSEKPADDDHPYGHARFEYLSGLAVAAMIIVIGFEMGKSSVEKILNPAAVTLSVPMLIVLIGSIAVKLWLCLFNRSLGKYIQSTALMATSADSRNDAISTSAVLAAAILEHFTAWKADGWMGLAVAALILYSGAMLAKDTISPLLGETASPELRELIISVVRSDPSVLGYHDLMVHDYGPGQRFASIHVEMDRNDDPMLCHERIDNLERVCLQQHNVHLVIHYDPVVTDDPEMDRLKTVVTDILLAHDPRISIHDFRMVQGQGHTNLIFDAALPAELMSECKQIKKHLDAQIALREQGQYYTVITFELAAFNNS